MGNLLSIRPQAATALLESATIVANNTVTIDGKPYIFVVTPAVEGDVALGAADTNALDNLRHAFNGTGTQVTNHFCAAAHPTVSAGTRTGTTMLAVSARVAGSGGNAIVLKGTASTALWYKLTNVAAADIKGAATTTLTGGLDAAVGDSWTFLNIAAAQTSLIKTGPGVLHSIVVGTGAAGTIIAYDALSAVAPIICTLTASATAGDRGLGTYLFDCEFKVGLTIVTSAATLITVMYR